ncbi:uncharacterized protein LOC134533826 [Bacillus rossius redtenbacheri]|uniref:uncharacterized protein LOC134533826 n=1 Tax=Bacillus rossius redtenbacheri TaxID=93214 RepID=UPI002FDCAE6E
MAIFELNSVGFIFKIKKTVLKYLGNINLLWHHHVGNPFLYAANYFGSINIVSWIFIACLFWSVIYTLYGKVIRAILKRMGLSKQDRSHIVDAAWSIGFHFGSLPLSMAKIIPVHSTLAGEGNTDLKEGEFLSGVLFYSDDVIPSHAVVAFVILCGYHAHKVFFMHKKSPYHAEFFSDVLFLVVFISTYFLRRFHVGLIVMLAISVPAILANMTRILITLGKKRSVPVVKFVQYLIFTLHCFAWAGLFLVMFPKYLLWMTCSSKVANKDIPVLIVLNASLWVFYCFQILFSPASKVLKCLVLPPDEDSFPQDWIERALLPPPSDLARQLRLIREAARGNSRLSGRTVPQCHHSSTASLYQAIRCVMTLQRKIRRNRERKEQKGNATPSE